MVRLRRELEGLKLDHAVQPPPWSLSAEMSALVCPSWGDRVRDAIEPDTRVLFAGLPDLSLALAAADAGAQVTLTDIDPATSDDLRRRMTPEQSGRVQLLHQPYGKAAFTPSAFDRVVFADMLHAYEAPAWVMRKLQRELKVDGVLMARLTVAGDVAVDPDVPLQTAAEAPSEWQRRAVERAGRVLSHLAQGPAAELWFSGPALDAADRGALWPVRAAPLAPQIAAIGAHLHVESVLVGSSLRAAAVALIGHGPLDGARLLRGLPEWADDADRQATGGRVAIVEARRALMAGGKALRFG